MTPSNNPRATKDINILVVDDDEIDVQAVKRSVRRAGLPFGLYSASNGVEAIEVLRREHTLSDKPFLVLLDLNMPGSDGFDFLEQLRGDDQLHDQVVFVLTTSNRDEDRRRAYERFVAGYLVKSDLAPGYERLVDLIREYSATVPFPEGKTDPTSPPPQDD